MDFVLDSWRYSSLACFSFPRFVSDFMFSLGYRQGLCNFLRPDNDYLQDSGSLWIEQSLNGDASVIN